jgi:hypothetical protein
MLITREDANPFNCLQSVEVFAILTVPFAPVFPPNSCEIPVASSFRWYVHRSSKVESEVGAVIRDTRKYWKS